MEIPIDVIETNDKHVSAFTKSIPLQNSCKMKAKFELKSIEFEEIEGKTITINKQLEYMYYSIKINNQSAHS